MSTIAVAAMVSPKSQHASTKPCTSASCCSPSRLWKSVQLLINTDQREEFRKLFNDDEKLPHLVRVILTCRLSNNPLVYKNTIKIVDARLNEKFGKISATDLNALELALLQRHDHIAFSILQVLKQNATPAQCKQFLNHQWGKKKGNTALHLAAFWGMSKIVRLMLEMGADPTTENNRQLRPIDCTTHSEIIAQLQQSSNVIVKQQQQQQPQQQQRLSPSPPSSLLLKKAERLLRPLQTTATSTDQYIVQEDIRAPIMSPLSFSSSSSSSSSLSSFDHHCWTPPTSPIPHVESPILSIEKVIEEKELQQRDSLLIERPGCFPRQTTMIDDHSIVDDDNKKQQLEDDNNNNNNNNNNDDGDINNNINNDDDRIVLRKQKKVQFNPETILMDACIRGDKDELMEYIEKQDFKLDSIRDVQNRSLLHIALMHGHEHLVNYLFDKININYSDNDGWTCLHYAAALGLWQSLQFIASLPYCNINARTNHGLKIEDCPESEFGRRKCRIWFERLSRMKSPTTTTKKQLLVKKKSVTNLSV